jgi:hypothetical protein
MAYDTRDGLYYNFFVNDKEVNFNPSYLTDLEVGHSIFHLYPSISFIALNRKSLFPQGLAKPGNTFKLEMGPKEDHDDIETFENLIIEKMELADARYDMDGSLHFVITSKYKPELEAISKSKAYNDKKTSEVIEAIADDLSIDKDIQTTVNKGNWLKPSTQSYADFMKILKNRSIPSGSNASKMFLWIDLEGTLHFESINSMIKSSSVLELDFTKPETDFKAPTDFVYTDFGIRYATEDVNSSYTYYKYDKEGGETKDISTTDIKKLDGSDSEGIDDLREAEKDLKLLYGYYHDEMPSKYFKALYHNRTYNFPFQFSFEMISDPNVVPGSVIKMKFPHYNKDKDTDESLSGKYLVTGVLKREKENRYAMEVFVVSNSMKEDVPDYPPSSD